MNGRPGSWTHGPFLGLTDDPSDDNGEIPENTQTILIGMFRYQLTNQMESQVVCAGTTGAVPMQSW